MTSPTTSDPSTISNPLLSVADAIRRRRTIRHYRPAPVDPKQIQELVELTIEAPSSFNLQDRSLVVVSSADGLAALTAATGGQPQPQEAPTVIVFVAETLSWKADHRDIYEQAARNGAWSDEFVGFFSAASEEFQHQLENRGALREYAIKDAMIAASFFMLAAQELGLATSPMNGWDEVLVKQAIGIEHRPDLAIALLVSVGHATEDRPRPGRRPVDRNVYSNQYGQPWQ